MADSKVARKPSHVSENTLFEGNFPSTSPGGLIFGGAIKRRVFCVTGLGGLYLEGPIHGGAYFRNFTVYEYKT